MDDKWDLNKEVVEIADGRKLWLYTFAPCHEPEREEPEQERDRQEADPRGQA